MNLHRRNLSERHQKTDLHCVIIIIIGKPSVRSKDRRIIEPTGPYFRLLVRFSDRRSDTQTVGP
ncbi:hypothetical protein Hanom_Chr17g01543251 [Helianthus anomalus]